MQKSTDDRRSDARPHRVRARSCTLAAAERLTDARVAAAGVPLTAAGLRPPLHLNLCECYHRPGDPGRAREHLQRARAGIDELGDDDYGRLLRSGLERLTELVDH